jgi:YVTN family beta-propeller protein
MIRIVPQRALRLLAALLASFAAASPHAAPFVYVSRSTANEVAVYDAATNTLAATIPVGNRPFPIAISPDATRVLVGNGLGNTVDVIETAGHTVIATIPVGVNPYGIVINPAGTRAWVVNYGSISGSSVNVIDLATNTVVNTLSVPSSGGGVGITPDGTRVYVTLGGNNSVVVLDAVTDAVVTTIANVGSSPWGVAFSPDGSRAYVTNYASGNVSVIDTATNTVLARWTVGNNPVGISVSGDGARIYVANSGSDTLSIVDTTMGIMLNNLPVGSRPFGAATHPDGRMIYVTNSGTFQGNGSLMVVDGAANVILATVPTGLYAGTVGNYISPYTPPGAPTSLAAAPGDGKATVSFTAPFSDGGTPITQYYANCGLQTVQGTVSPIVVTGLTNGATVACRVFAMNARGQGPWSTSVNVTPAARPGAPSVTGVTRGNASVSVAFAPPSSNGGAAITGYTATCGNQSQTGTATPIVVTGLTNGTPVTCTVFATNVIGDGAPSAPSASVTPMTVPGAPVVTSVVRGAGIVTLTFDPPADDGGGGLIGNYHVACQPGDLLLSGMGSPLVVEGLEDEDATYECTLSAVNEVGPGAPAAITVLPRPATDVAVTVSNGTDYVYGGSDVSYTIDVTNLGANAANGTRIVDDADPTFTSRTWTCTGNGAQCPSASGTGDIDFVADLPAGASLRIVLSVHVAAAPETPLTYGVAVTAPGSVRDTNAANNSATDGPDPVGLFHDGFD